MNRRDAESNHEEWVPSAVPFFLIGFVYYFISPPFVLKFLSDDSGLLYVATQYIDPDHFDASYFFDAIVILASFLLGYFLARAWVNAKISVLDYGSFQKSFPLLLAISFCVLIVYFGLTAAASGASFFTGYSTYNISVLGPFSTCAFMAAWFVNYFSKNQIKYLFLAFFLLCSVLLLGWGSRMYFILGFMALALGIVSKNKKLLKSFWFYSSIFLLFFLMVVVGIVREGGRELSSDQLIAVFFAEPLFTSITGSLYLDASGGRPVYGVPYDLFVSIIHFIPSAVYPGKMALISEITPNENIISPFGAKALIVNLYSNFGMFYPIFIAVIGFYYGFLYKKAQTSGFFRATYFSALPVILLLFFRESLITVIKVMFFNGLIAPLCVALLLISISPRTIADIRRRISHNRAGKKSASSDRRIETARPVRS